MYQDDKMKIAVIGGGIFGVVISVKLSEFHTVDLFEKNADIMMAASDVNQCRIHRGYHYPRSDDTTKEVLAAYDSFTTEFNEAIMKSSDNYYCLSKFDSLVNSDEYLNFCKRNNLEFSEVSLDLVDKKSIQLCLKVDEYSFDHEKLKKICWENLKKSNVNIHFNSLVDDTIYEKYDLVIISTYTDINPLLKQYPKNQRNYQFEICEKIFFELPKEFENKSIIILDGPFMSIDPVGNKNYSIVGDVIHSVHSTNIGKNPIIDPKYLPLLNNGIIKNPPITNKNLFLESASRFFPKFKDAKYVGSSFCIKTVLPNLDSTDARPTLVNRVDDKIITVFSGKIPTCVESAKQILNMINKIKS